ncbi:MAG: hypothetical protein KDA85_13245, partial [Planctomycetaceae bacterium]|nr:hypothetical protein [Planctomycetaceae bacterium]
MPHAQWIERRRGQCVARNGFSRLISAGYSRWLLSALLVAVPCSLLTASKQGGMMNCLLPAVVSGIAVFLYWSRPLERILQRSLTLRIGRFSCSGSGLVTGALLAEFLVLVLGNARSDVTFGDRGFSSVVDQLSRTSLSVACPQDPGVLVMSGHPAGRSLILEFDAARWPEQFPRDLLGDPDEVDVFVTVGRQDDWRSWPLTAGDLSGLLRSHGFQPVPVPELIDSVYQLWRRTPALARHDRQTTEAQQQR